jgi:hypothetical protein
MEKGEHLYGLEGAYEASCEVLGNLVQEHHQDGDEKIERAFHFKVL